MPSLAIAELTAASSDDVLSREYSGAAIVASPAVPVEIVRAAGLRPVVVRGSTDPTPTADAHLEANVFPGRLRRLVDLALTGQLARAACIVVPRTSDADHKSFLYLREFARQGVALPPVILYDLLQSRSAVVRAYIVERTHALAHALASLADHPLTDDDVRREIEQANAARAAARRVVALRHSHPRVSGGDAFRMLGAFWQMAPGRYATLAHRAADDIALRPPREGPRVLLAGAPIDVPVLHQAIDAEGGTVVAEPGMWGSSVATDDITDVTEPMAAIARKYADDAFGPRLPIDVVRARTWPLLDTVDAVVISLPPDDAVFGWDYPALRDLLDARGIPHMCLRADLCTPLPSHQRERIGALLAVAMAVSEERHA